MPLPERPLLAEDATNNTIAPSQAEATELAETKLPLTLTGTLLSGDPQAVLVNNDSGEQHIYRPGDKVLDGVVLQEVRQSQVILTNDGVLETLTKGPGVIATRPSVDGEWQSAYLLNGQLVDYGPVVKVTEVDGAIRIASADMDEPLTGRIDDRSLTVYGDPVGLPADLHGEFNNAFSEVELASPALTAEVLLGRGGVGDAVCTIKLTRLDEESQRHDPRVIRQARNDEVRAMYEPLKRYAEDHQGQFPAALEQLVPNYVDSLALYSNQEDRDVQYISGLKQKNLKLQEVGPIPNCSKGGDISQALLSYEAQLQRVWGGPIPVAPVLLEVTYSQPDGVWTVNIQGGISVRSILGGVSQSGDSVAQWQAMVASDQNNLKQMGLVNKMFQNEHCDYFMPGFCTVYPEYLTDPNVLTSPWDEPGTVSYDILFPAAHQQDLEALGVEIIAAEGGNTDPDNPALSAMAESEVPFMFNKTDIPAFGGRPAGRNVLFLDGHVQFMKSDEFEKRVGPFLR